MLSAAKAEKTATSADSFKHHDTVVSKIARWSKNDSQTSGSVGGNQIPPSIFCIWQSNSKIIQRLAM